jgi:hypothetical protein
MFSVLSHLARCAGLEFSRRMQGSASPAGADRCCVCGDAAAHRTRCCQAPLCDYHARAWANDPNPCACRR